MAWQDAKGINHVDEVRRVVAEFEVRMPIVEPDGIVHVKVYEDTNGRYSGYSDYRIQNPDQGDPYRSIALQQSIDDALKDSIRGLTHFWPSEAAKQAATRWFKDPDF